MKSAHFLVPISMSNSKTSDNTHGNKTSSFPGSSTGKESTCSAGDPGSIPGSRRTPGEGIGYPLWYSGVSLVAQLVKKSTCNARGLGLIPGLGRSPGEGKCYPLQYSGLENSLDCIVDGVAKSQTRLSNFHLNLPISKEVDIRLTRQTL